jgi:hypothetical protein
MKGDDGVSNFSSNETFEEIAQERLSRRSVLGGGVASAVAASLGGVGSLLQAVPADALNGGGRPLLGFEGIPVSAADKLVVPNGYTAKVLIAWGDPVSDGPAFKQDASNTADEQAKQWGSHNDGMVYFPLQGSKRGLLVQNHEYTDDVLLNTDGADPWTPEKTRKSLAAHGVGIIEIEKVKGRRGAPDEWRVVRPSYFARRITGDTPIRIGGPAKGDARLKTSVDTTGRWVRGTLNNCAMGFTPWGTYLACEENFNGYFVKSQIPDPNDPTGVRRIFKIPQTPDELRYGINTGFGYLWHTTDKRFNVDEEPNEPYRFGWVTEINPFNPRSTPVKRTALGRFKHEGAWVQEALDGRVVVYSGDDERFEYIYRYVSELPWRKSFARGIHPLNRGTLYVARFDADGTGEWLPLTPDNPKLAGWTIADILIRTRAAADLLGATKMDRPEWIDTFPKTLTAIATLTNNTRRGSGTNPGVDASNPRAINNYGHIITWSYRTDWTEDFFRWDFFALAGDPADPSDGSTIVGDKYGSPDGIYVAPSGRLWIQTDVSAELTDPNLPPGSTSPYVGFGNNQMLCADPESKETRRFLVGPVNCEITGVFVTPDERTMFVGIQHPGEAPGILSNDPSDPKRYSSWPDGDAGERPRSATVVVTKDDGGQIGS